MGPDFFAHHLRRLATEDLHVHMGLDGAQIDLYVPALVIQFKDLFSRINGRIEQGGDDSQFLDATTRGGVGGTYFAESYRLWTRVIRFFSHPAGAFRLV